MQNPEILVPSPDELIELDVFINYRTQASLWERGSDSSKYVLRVSADIGGCADLSPDDPQLIEFKLGELLFYIIRVGNAINDGFPLVELFDILQETADAASAVFQPDFGDFKTAVRSRFPDALPNCSAQGRRPTTNGKTSASGTRAREEWGRSIAASMNSFLFLRAGQASIRTISN